MRFDQLNRLMSIPHCFAFSSALSPCFPPVLPPPPFFLCFIRASATVKPGAPERIKFSSSSSSSSSLSSLDDKGVCCLTTRFWGGLSFDIGLEAVSCFNFVISNKLNGGVGGEGRGELIGEDGAPPLLLRAVGCGDSGIDLRIGAGLGFATGGARKGDGGIPTGILPGDGSGELSDFNDCRSSCRSRSISSFFFCCSRTNDDTETSSFVGFGTVRDTLAADIVSMSRTRSRSRSFSSAAYTVKCK